MAALRAQSGAASPPDVTRCASQVIVIGSSSRGGSSIFAEVLRNSRRMLHLRAEINPFFRLHGVDDPQSDALAAATPVPAALGQELGWDCGWPTNTLQGETDEWRFAVEIAVRLTLQWPSLSFDADTVHRCVQGVLRELRENHGWPPGLFADPPHFHARLISALRVHWPEIQPAAYDLDQRLMAALSVGPVVGPVSGPVDFVPRGILEEPPFVLTGPWVVADEERLATHPLVIKTPSNAYRLDWLRRVFASARLRVLHLTLRRLASPGLPLPRGRRAQHLRVHRRGRRGRSVVEVRSAGRLATVRIRPARAGVRFPVAFGARGVVGRRAGARSGSCVSAAF
jgi:hypothetical protein